MPTRSFCWANHACAGGVGVLSRQRVVTVMSADTDQFTDTSGTLSHFQPCKEYFTHRLKRAFSHSNTDTRTKLLTSCVLPHHPQPLDSTHTVTGTHTHKQTHMVHSQKTA